MIKRTLETTLLGVSRQYPVTTLTGPRQSGKTTLVRNAFPNHDYASLEEPDQRALALEDPRGFLGQFGRKVILDEVQRAPDLFSYIQTRVDERGIAGQYILTGSQDFLLMNKISQSLAGRAAILHLLPFSLSELEGRHPLTLSDIGKKMPTRKKNSIPDLYDVLFEGFYPRIHDKGLAPQRWLADYYKTYVERDVRTVLNVGDVETFGRFVRLCAGRNGQLLNLSSLSNDCGVTHSTAKRWLSILETSFLVILLRPHHRNFNKRIVKSPKLYFLDTGLLCYLLKIRSPGDVIHHASRGSIFESFAVAELLKNYLNRGKEPDLYFWRDSTGHEVDVLIDVGGELTPIEVKSGQTFAKDFIADIQYWRTLAGRSSSAAAVIYGGDKSFRREDIAVYSWSCL